MAIGHVNIFHTQIYLHSEPVELHAAATRLRIRINNRFAVGPSPRTSIATQSLCICSKAITISLPYNSGWGTPI